MKKIEAVVRLSQFDRIRDALADIGVRKNVSIEGAFMMQILLLGYKLIF